MSYTTTKWVRWGLCIVDAIRSPESNRVASAHEKVADYLDKHPEAAAKYKTDQSGEIKYFDVLKLAEEGSIADRR